MSDQLPEGRQNERQNPADAPSRKPNGHDLHPDQELAYRLKSAIDQKGRYSFRLNDLAAGFASGRNVSHTMARQTIEKQFSEQMGMSPQEYLDRHYAERRQKLQEIERSRSTQTQGRGRGW